MHMLLSMLVHLSASHFALELICDVLANSCYSYPIIILLHSPIQNAYLHERMNMTRVYRSLVYILVNMSK